jgi:hypothetical protein
MAGRQLPRFHSDQLSILIWLEIAQFGGSRLPNRFFSHSLSFLCDLCALRGADVSTAWA